MNYQEACEYQEAFIKYGNTPDAESIHRLCDAMGRPQEKFRLIRILGEDDVSYGAFGAYLSSILKKSGYRVGRSFLPEFEETREQIRINGLVMAEGTYCRGMEWIRNACEAICKAGAPQPTHADIQAALAVWFFAEKRCSMVLAEEYGEQAAMWKVLSEAVGGAEVIKLDLSEWEQTAWPTGRVHRTKKLQQFQYEGYEKLTTGLYGKNRITEAILAIEAVRSLRQYDLKITETAVVRGLEEATWTGHYEVLAEHPAVIADTAHDVPAVRELMEILAAHTGEKQLVFIVGMLRDADYEKMIGLFSGHAQHILTVTAAGEKYGMTAIELASEIHRVHAQVTAADSVEEALEIGRLIAGKEGVVAAFGSRILLSKMMATVKLQKRIRQGASGASGQNGHKNR